ncbi:MAG TPA: CPBP family intramembrane glutamic endopeptidase [Terriglobia bacterium]|nr:CPBP family intramembrane glutamic endopeptidase [Terriglobia bacterium]
MPIKLTGREYKIIATAVVVAGISLAIGVKYFWRAFPEAAIEFRVTKNDSEPIAEQFLAQRGIHLEGFRHAAAFEYDDEAKVFLERTQGLERMNDLTHGPVRLWRWTHRWFKSQQKEEYRVEVTPAGEVDGFDHEIEEKTPGANLDPSQAQTVAESFLRDVMKRDLNDLEFVDSDTTKRPARTDHSFTWKIKSVNLGDGSLRITLEVDGDQLAGYREFVKVPDQWSRDYQTLRSRNDSAQEVDQLFMVFLCVAMLIYLVMRIRDGDVPWRLAISVGLVGTGLYFLKTANDFSLEQFGYRTTDPYSSFLVSYILQSVLSSFAVGVFVFLLIASGEPIYRESFPRLQSLRHTFTWSGLRSRSFFIANVVGIGLTFFFFAYQTIFYLVANKLGAWAPAEVNYSDLLNTRIPWVWVLFIGFLPAIFEEMMFRAFAIPFLRKFLHSLPLALVFAAFIWGFGHSAYPNQPFYIRGLEVGLGGIVMGIMMLRFGIVATMIWHYSVDALYTAFLLLRSHNSYLMVSGGITAGIMLVPLGLALAAYLRTGTFLEEGALTNASAGISRVPRVSAAVETAPLVYQPLNKSRLILAGAFIAVFGAAALMKVYKFGDGITLRLTRHDAMRSADEFIKKRNVDPSRYHSLAVLDENVDGTDIRYFLERRTVKESDEIYRRATRLLLWEVRYFRPLEKEEHHVFVDADGGGVFTYQHVLDEDAPGASLSMDQARAIAEQEADKQGFALSGFDLQDSQAEKRKARQDYTFVWQAKAGDPRNVGDAHFRIRVDVAGDQVVGFSRFFKLPDDWLRERQGRRLSAILLGIARAFLFVILAGGGIMLLVKQIKNGSIAWSSAAKVGAAFALISMVEELNALSTVENFYNTSMPMNLFRLLEVVQFAIVPLVFGLFSWLLVGLATSLFPDAWRVFKGPARRVWRKDAAVAVLVALSASAGLAQISSYISDRFHAYVPVDISLVPNSIDASWPVASIFLSGFSRIILGAPAVAMIIYLVLLGIRGRKWWLAGVGLIFLISLGPSSARSVREYLLGWVLGFVTASVAISVLVLFYRDNILAYFASAFLLSIVGPMVDLLSQPPPFFVWNGVVLAVLMLCVVTWMFTGRAEPQPEVPTTLQPEIQA